MSKVVVKTISSSVGKLDLTNTRISGSVDLSSLLALSDLSITGSSLSVTVSNPTALAKAKYETIDAEGL